MSKVTILVSSFDGFSDCWKPFCHGINKYWPDCPYPIFLITNHLNVKDDRVATLKVGEDKGWSANLLVALEQIDSPYILYFQEDYWINRTVDSARISDYVELMDKKGVDYIRLLAFPAPDYGFPDDQRLGILATQAAYRTSVQISLWRKEVLQELLDPRESAWEFEVNGTERSRKFGDTFLCTQPVGTDPWAPYHNGIYYVCTAINRGRWARAAKRYAQDENIEVNFSRLPSETWWHDFQRSGRLGALSQVLIHRLSLLRHPKLLKK